jgi:hypothetical protein
MNITEFEINFLDPLHFSLIIYNPNLTIKYFSKNVDKTNKKLKVFINKDQSVYSEMYSYQA